MQALVEHRGKQFLVEENIELKVPFLGGKEGDRVYYGKPMLYDDENVHYMYPNVFLLNLNNYSTSYLDLSKY